MLQTISILVSGRVQGVFFRQSAREKAYELGIKGFVKNLPDDTVYIEGTGTRQQLDELVAWCKIGPPKAQVTGTVITALPLRQFDRFTIERY